ncbi:unnamed protein product [Larinioides sclopetarius]|uniref:Katanin p80 WD40 repeat-containing subunit B1 n=1 Tax=Larinioides sclopetarius TaxID=280406 RepID=A0AAV1ZS86_9ARAC
MRCLSPPRRQPGSIFYVEKRPDNRTPPDWKEAAYSVRWEEFVAHGGCVTCLALGRKSGRVMVTGGEDKKVNLWAVGKSNCIMSLSGHTSPIECVKFGQCEDIVCAGSSNGALKIWDLEAAKIIRTLLGHKGNVKCVDFHPYGDFVASGSSDSNIKLWDKRRKGSIFTYKGHTKAVNTLKFSPDGRWIASGSEDGVIKLWDLPAGKLRTEFKGHTSGISDIEFHPNELLLASCSSDQFVKFWDLENHRLVSHTDGDSGPVQKIYFSPNGCCLFSGAQDILKVYAWEPIRTLDTLVMGWGKVSDISSSESQLIIGAFNLTNVSVYIMDLRKVQPIDSWLKQSELVRTPGSGCSFDDVDLENDPSRITERIEYLENYHSDIENSILSTDIDLSKTHILGVDLSTFLPPLDDPMGSQMEARCQNPFNCTYKLTNIQGKPMMLALPMAVTHPYNYENDRAYDNNSDSVNQNSLPILQGESLKHSQPMAFPDVEQKCELDAVHQSRTKSFGIELDDFLPRNTDSSKSGYGSLEISDAEAISSIYRGHESMVKVLGHRKKYLQSVMRIWKTEGPLAGLTSAIHMSDSAILVDILTLLIIKPSSWTLDMCQLLLPVICDLLKSKYETYITIGCMTLKLIMKNFSQVIKINISAPKGIGIDISREERYKKCRVCFSHLIALRSVVLQRQSAEGQLGKLFSELHQLLQTLDQ